jgi:hypothetical protein
MAIVSAIIHEPTPYTLGATGVELRLDGILRDSNPIHTILFNPVLTDFTHDSIGAAEFNMYMYTVGADSSPVTSFTMNPQLTSLVDWVGEETAPVSTQKWIG